MSETVAYKILTAAQWAEWQASGVFAGAPVDLADGYIHLSAADQVHATIEKHFAGQDNLWAILVDLTALGEMIRWEPARGGALFPHVYGILPLEAVLAHGAVYRDAVGKIIVR